MHIHMEEPAPPALCLGTPVLRQKVYLWPSNYSGITILSNTSKIPEKLRSIYKNLGFSPTLNPLQGGFKSTLVVFTHAAFIFKEAIQSLTENDQKAYSLSKKQSDVKA